MISHICPVAQEFLKTKGHKGKETLVAVINVINSRLAKRTFLVTERMSIADIAIFAAFAEIAQKFADLFSFGIKLLNLYFLVFWT